MKHLSSMACAMALMAMTAACDVSVKSDEPIMGLQTQSDYKNWPEYTAGPLAGTIFDTEWKAVTAIARPSLSEPDQISIDVFSELLPNACGNQISSKPYMNVLIPKTDRPDEYFVNLNEGGKLKPVVFIGSAPEFAIDPAAKTKIKVLSYTESGFEALIYAKSETSGKNSEINGKIQVRDCSKTAEFSVWNDLAGWYSLASFDGVAQDKRTAIVEFSNRVFLEKTSQLYLKALAFPLFHVVSPGSDRTLKFGPMEGLGVTTVSEANGLKIMKYSYHGPVNFKGTDIQMEFDLKVIKSNAGLDVEYSLEIPSYVALTKHKFTLVK